MNDTFTCPCCGFSKLESKPYPNMPSLLEARKALPPYEDIWGMGSYEVCSCCGYEFGADDNPGGDVPGDSFESALGEFIGRSCEWFEPKDKPTNWSLKKQLQDAGLPIPEGL